MEMELLRDPNSSSCIGDRLDGSQDAPEGSDIPQSQLEVCFSQWLQMKTLPEPFMLTHLKDLAGSMS